MRVASLLAVSFALLSAGVLAAPVIRTEPKPWGTDYTLVSNDGTNDVTLVSVKPACVKYASQMANMYSDDAYGVAVRAWDLRDEMIQADGELRVVVPGGRAGAVASVIEGPRERLAERFVAAGRAHGAAMNAHGGPLAASSDLTSLSYMFAHVSPKSCDDDIEIARRGGIGIVHFHGWWEYLGHYPVNRRTYPAGFPDFKACVDRVHAAGLRAGMHTLSGCIGFKDPCLVTPAVRDLQHVVRYTLAADLPADAAELTVRERPAPCHDRVMTYSGNGNVIRIGTELIEYSDFTVEPPYRFTGLVRGRYGSPVAAHAAGERADYLRQRYLAFYPEPGTKLADEVAEAIAKVYNTCGIDQIYFDGSEGMGTRYNIDWMRNRMFRALGRDAIIEASHLNAHNWYFHSRLNAWDYPYWGLNKFNDIHYRVNSTVAKADLLRPQMGWWYPIEKETPQHRGHLVEELEYLTGKTAALDSSFALNWVSYESTAQLLHTTIVGWYERFRLAHAFSDEALARFATPGAESRLRQDADGVWRVQEVVRTIHRVTGPGTGSEAWSVPSAEACPVSVRVEALYEADPAGKAVTLLPAGRFPSKTWDYPYFDASGCDAFSFDVTGDGSGRTLVFTLTTPREFSAVKAEHRIKVDFTGRRRVTVYSRERDVAADEPLNLRYAVYRNALKPEHIGSASFRWDDGQDGAPLEIGAVTARATRRTTAANAVLTANGRAISVPFALVSGESAVLEGGTWIRYSRDNEPLERRSGPVLDLVAGANAFAWEGGTRAEVIVTALGRKFPALRPTAKPVDLIYQVPQIFAPAHGFDSPVTLPVAAGESRQLRVEILDAADRPTLDVGGVRVGFPVTLRKGDHLSCLDGTHWRVTDARREMRSEGTLATPLPKLTKTTAVSFSTADDAKAVARILLSSQTASGTSSGLEGRCRKGQ